MVIAGVFIVGLASAATFGLTACTAVSAPIVSVPISAVLAALPADCAGPPGGCDDSLP